MLNDVIDPLRKFVSAQKLQLRQLETTFSRVELTYLNMKTDIEGAKTSYFAAHKALDDAMDAYHQSSEGSPTSPERKRRLNQKITQLLQSCRSTEKDYTRVIYSIKDGRMEYSKALVSAVTHQLSC